MLLFGDGKLGKISVWSSQHLQIIIEMLNEWNCSLVADFSHCSLDKDVRGVRVPACLRARVRVYVLYACLKGTKKLKW